MGRGVTHTARKWMSVSGGDISAQDLEPRIRVSPEFAGKLHETLAPGATIIVTDQPAVRKASRNFTILAD